MIPVAIPASQVPETRSAAMSSGTPDKGFISILKSSVQQPEKIENEDQPAPAQETASKTASPTKSTLDSTDTAVSKNRSDAQPAKDPDEVLRQLIMQMTASAQQMMPAPVVKESPAATSVAASESAQLLQIQEVLLQLPGNIAGTPATIQEQNNPEIFLKTVTENASDIADFKGAILNAVKNPQQDIAANTVLGESDAAKVEAGADLKAFGLLSKDAALTSRTSDAFDDGFTQWKIETSSGRT